jgi:hypothetical protein
MKSFRLSVFCVVVHPLHFYFLLNRKKSHNCETYGAQTWGSYFKFRQRAFFSASYSEFPSTSPGPCWHNIWNWLTATFSQIPPDLLTHIETAWLSRNLGLISGSCKRCLFSTHRPCRLWIEYMPWIPFAVTHRPEHETKNLSPSNAQPKTAWSYTSTVAYTLMWLCLIKHWDHFIILNNITSSVNKSR